MYLYKMQCFNAPFMRLFLFCEWLTCSCRFDRKKRGEKKNTNNESRVENSSYNMHKHKHTISPLRTKKKKAKRQPNDEIYKYMWNGVCVCLFVYLFIYLLIGSWE